MKYFSKLARSQKAHARLKTRYRNSLNLLSRIKAMYHGDVEFEQRRLGRVLSKRERRDRYKRVNSFYQNGAKKGRTPKQLDLDYMTAHYNPFD